MMAMYPDPPIPESYWVQPGQLLAGAYPLLVGAAEPATRQRVRQFLAVGITSFVDLTGGVPKLLLLILYL